MLVDHQLLLTGFLVASLWFPRFRLRKQDFFRRWARAWNAFAGDLGIGASAPRTGALNDTTETDVALHAGIIERDRLGEALRQSEERFRMVANSSPVLIWMTGLDNMCDYFNPTWLEFTGRAIEAELQNGWEEDIHPEDRKVCLETYAKASASREPFRRQFRLRRHDGEWRWMLDIGVPRFNADGSLAGYIGYCIDFTEHKLGEEALSSLSRRLMEAHEEERAWIARELHDDVSQRIVLLTVRLEKIERDLPASAVDARLSLQEAQKHISDLGNEIQRLSHGLHSSKLEYLGIAEAARSFCKEISEQKKVEIEVNYSCIPQSLSPEIALCLFRVLQEALQNAVKHSGVTHFTVELSGATDEVHLAVSDSGLGFEPSAAIYGSGLGLISMQERLRLVDGQLAIESRPGRGTTVRARVPLR